MSCECQVALVSEILNQQKLFTQCIENLGQGPKVLQVSFTPVGTSVISGTVDALLHRNMPLHSQTTSWDQHSYPYQQSCLPRLHHSGSSATKPQLLQQHLKLVLLVKAVLQVLVCCALRKTI